MFNANIFNIFTSLKGRACVNKHLLKFWRVYDYLYQHVTRIQYVDKKNGNVFRVVFCKYHGQKLITDDGVEVYNGDSIIKLHLYNYKLSKSLSGIENNTKLALTTLRLVKESLPGLAKYIENNPKGKKANVIVGTTFLHRGVYRLGFNVAYVPNKMKYKIKNNYLKLLLVVVHPDGLARLNYRKETLNLKRVYISKKKLISKYIQE